MNRLPAVSASGLPGLALPTSQWSEQHAHAPRPGAGSHTSFDAIDLRNSKEALP